MEGKPRGGSRRRGQLEGWGSAGPSALTAKTRWAPRRAPRRALCRAPRRAPCWVRLWVLDLDEHTGPDACRLCSGLQTTAQITVKEQGGHKGLRQLPGGVWGRPGRLRDQAALHQASVMCRRLSGDLSKGEA